ncbi:hypothetical protein KEG38_41175 [Polyangium jinanense]|uniref:hypothetical protein n=1 Tax=Polyangium jinanense TaxID=2829994 RepID=UPI0023421BB9|nr:hypothetical protein [Polyangium jinanense]MDC3960338.1 hypothetical protein [Polyangium jinanense]
MQLWIDTNCARSVVDLKEIARLARGKGITLVIHPQVYLERRRQMRVEKGAQFKAAAFDGFLAQQEIRVPPFLLDQPLAATWADALYERYPTIEAWEGAKQRTLGGVLRGGFAVLPGDMPMTTDWLISLLVASDPSARIVTHDDGEEWRALREAKQVLSWNEAMAWLEALPPA